MQSQSGEFAHRLTRSDKESWPGHQQVGFHYF